MHLVDDADDVDPVPERTHGLTGLCRPTWRLATAYRRSSTETLKNFGIRYNIVSLTLPVPQGLISYTDSPA